MKTRKITANSILCATLSLVLSLLTSCENDNEPDAAKLLIGKWENTEINNLPVLTDSKFVMELRSDNHELYANGFQLDENNKSWEENNSYTYSVQNDILTIDGKNVLDNMFHMEFKILTCKVTRISVIHHTIVNSKINLR